MRNRTSIRVKPVTMEDIIHVESIEICIENGVVNDPDRCASLLKSLSDGDKAAAAIVSGQVPASNTLRHNLEMTSMRDQLRYLCGALVCRKCQRLYWDTDRSHRTCGDCYSAWCELRAPRHFGLSYDEEPQYEVF